MTQKLIFHWKLCSHWLPNASESNTNNMKSTWPTREFCIGDPMLPIFHLFVLEVCIGGNAILAFALGVTQILAFLIPTCRYSERKTLALGVLPKATAQRKCFCIAVKYRLWLYGMQYACFPKTYFRLVSNRRRTRQI